MKKLMMMMLMLSAVLTASGQGEWTNGVYEKKVVVTADSVNAGTLYVRALEALSDLAGSQGKSKIGIDVQDKDEGLIVYKGMYYLGYAKANMLYGWDTFADFTLKVRCKDGKAQITVTVPTMSYTWDGEGHNTRTFPITEFLPVYKYKGDYKIKKAAQLYAPKVAETFDMVLGALEKRIKKGADDDF